MTRWTHRWLSLCTPLKKQYTFRPKAKQTINDNVMFPNSNHVISNEGMSVVNGIGDNLCVCVHHMWHTLDMMG